MNLLHLSDLHIGNLLTPQKERDRCEDLFDAMIKKWDSTDKALRPVVVITGDIVDSGLKWQYKKAAKLIDKLKQQFTVIALPGNHDYGLKGNIVTDKSFKLFQEFIHPTADYPELAHESESYTLICLNSMLAVHGWSRYGFAEGELGKAQLENLSSLVDDIRVKKGVNHWIAVALHHHPMELNCCNIDNKAYHRLTDGLDLLNLIKGKVDILLFGHEHVDCSWVETAKFKIKLIHMCGKSSSPGRKVLTRINDDGGKLAVENIVLGDEGCCNFYEK